MNKENVVAFTVLILVVFLLFYQNIRLNNRLSVLETRISEYYLPNDEYVVEVSLPDSFDYVFNRFKVYNSKIDTETVVQFLAVIDTFGLREDPEHLDWFIGQILTESGAKQFDHNGNVLRGSVGEVGISQIRPSTAIDYFVRLDNVESLDKLGVSDYSFVFDKKMKNELRREKMVDWLSDVNNNMALWGFITKHKLKNNDILKALIAYNAGTGGLKRFLSRFKHPSKHKYIKAIKDTLDYTSKALKS